MSKYTNDQKSKQKVNMSILELQEFMRCVIANNVELELSNISRSDYGLYLTKLNQVLESLNVHNAVINEVVDELCCKLIVNEDNLPL